MLSILSRLSTLNRTLVQISQNGYKSSISLDKLYPKSNLDTLAKPDIQLESKESFSGYIPMGFLLKKIKFINIIILIYR